MEHGAWKSQGGCGIRDPGGQKQWEKLHNHCGTKASALRDFPRTPLPTQKGKNYLSGLLSAQATLQTDINCDGRQHRRLQEYRNYLGAGPTGDTSATAT